MNQLMTQWTLTLARRRLATYVAVALMALATGCGSEAGSAGEVTTAADDGGAALDGQQTADGNTATDADTGGDTGDASQQDASGGAVDVGAVDAGPNAGTPDAGTPDAGTPDAGASLDAGSAPSGACTNKADQALVASGKVDKAIEGCAMASFGNADKAKPCIKKETGLTDGCVACFANHLGCTFKSCLLDCMGGQTPGCDKCLAKNCNASFTACSGLQP